MITESCAVALIERAGAMPIARGGRAHLCAMQMASLSRATFMLSAFVCFASGGSPPFYCQRSFPAFVGAPHCRKARVYAIEAGAHTPLHLLGLHAARTRESLGQLSLPTRARLEVRPPTTGDSFGKSALFRLPFAETTRRKLTTVSAAESKDTDNSATNGWSGNENVEVDVLVEDANIDEDLTSTVQNNANALIAAALNPEKDPNWGEEIELSIVLCSDEHIQQLNQQWRGKNSPTDVLSFVQDPDSACDGVLGDLVISIPTAQRQASERNHSLLAELRILMVHGLLHLLGYDHEESQEELVEMADAEQRLMARLGWEGDGLISSVG